MVAYVEYLGQTIYPAHLAFLYPYPEAGVSVAEVMFASLFLLVVSVIFFVWRKTYPFALTGWLWFLGMLVPMREGCFNIVELLHCIGNIVRVIEHIVGGRFVCRLPLVAHLCCDRAISRSLVLIFK